MWVFAYGSLMADGWEKSHDCSFRCTASLLGFSRSFDKASTESRGTREHPAPTLRIVPTQFTCHGVAFKFSEQRRADVLRDLLEREGKSFPLREKLVRLSNGEDVAALVPMYEGKQIIANKTLSEIASMAIRAKGRRGTGVQYVRDIASHLKAAGIEDLVVTNLLQEVERILSERS